MQKMTFSHYNLLLQRTVTYKTKFNLIFLYLELNDDFQKLND